MNTGNRKARRGFTLVEMLTVVAIVAILVAILVPAVSAVRKNARATATRGAIQTISTGISAYQADQRVGGSYPPSRSDEPGPSAIAPYTFRVANPYRPDIPDPSIRVTGAGLLVWALAGADLLGTPGFRTFRSGSSYWALDTDAQDTAVDNRGAYALRPNREPWHPRSGPYVDLAKVRVTSYVRNGVGNAASNGFPVPAEEEARRQSSGNVKNANYTRQYPMFLDGYGFPILYWRADAAGTELATAKVGGGGGQLNQANRRGVYEWGDNQPLLNTATNLSPGQGGNTLSPGALVLRPNPNPHVGWAGIPSNADPKAVPDPLRGFPKYIRNDDVKARFWPHNPDSYLLVSPGDDGVYGTADDIANFSHNGAQLEALAP